MGILLNAAPPRSGRLRGGGRQTRPDHWQPFGRGGAGMIPRRAVPGALGCDPAALSTGRLLERHFTGHQLFRVFEVLLDMHGGLKQAKSNMLRLAFGPGKTRVVVYTEARKGGGGGSAPAQDASEERDDALTSEAEDLLRAQPREVGGLLGLQTALAIQCLTPGMVCLEAVPGPRGTGLHRLWPVDPLTVELGRERNDPDADLSAYQHQAGRSEPVRLRPETFFWAAVDATPQNVYGVGLFSAGFAAAVADMAMNQNLRDAVRNAAWPRLWWKILLERITREAVEVRQLSAVKDPDTGLSPLDRFVGEEVDAIRAELEAMDPDSNPMTTEDVAMTPIAGGDFSGLSEILRLERARFVQAVDMLPTLMGAHQGATQTFSGVEWSLQADKVEWLRAFVNAPIEWALETHFLLTGRVVTVKLECEPVRTVDVVQEANAEATRTKTVGTWERRGYITPEEGSMLLTGSGMADPSRGGAVGSGEDDPDSPGNGGGGSTLPNEGTTTEERDADT